MKTRVIFILLLFPFILSAQSKNIQQLKDQVLGTTGRVYIVNMTKLAEGYLNENMTDLALKATKVVIEKAEEIDDSNLLAKALSVDGKAWKQKGKLSKAQRKLKQSQKLLTKLDDHALQFENAYILLQIAQLRGKSKSIKAAETQIAVLKDKIKLTSTSVAELKKIGIYKIIFPEAVAFEKMEQEKNTLAGKVEDLKESKEELTEKSEILAERSEALEGRQVQLNELVKQKEVAIIQMTESQAKTELLLAQQKRVVDSMDFEREIDSLVIAISDKELKETETQLKEQEIANDLQQSQRNFFIALTAIGLLIAFGMFLRFLSMKSHAAVLEEKNKLIEQEKQRSEELLLNILPKAIAIELKEQGQAKVRHYKNVTVLFADFKNFSKIAKQLPPEVLIEELDYCFKNFDFITSNLQLEKIKTIGDAYMCAGGLPTADNDHPLRVIQAALEMQNFLEELKKEKVAKGVPFFEARIGIHSGPIIAGVVGLNKFAYDIWGDTVNVASRMETGSEPGRVNISGATYELVKNEFEVEYRGKVPAKNMGEIDMYFVEG